MEGITIKVSKEEVIAMFGADYGDVITGDCGYFACTITGQIFDERNVSHMDVKKFVMVNEAVEALTIGTIVSYREDISEQRNSVSKWQKATQDFNVVAELDIKWQKATQDFIVAELDSILAESNYWLKPTKNKH